MPAYTATRRVEFQDTDMAGIAHFSSYYRWMEQTEHEALRDRGFSVVSEVNGQQLGWPRVAANCEFIAPVRFEDVLSITVSIERLGTKSVTYRFLFSCDANPIAKGTMTSVCCRVNEDETLQAIPIPPSIMEKLRTLTDQTG